MKTKVTPSIPSSEAKKAYTKLEAERIRHEIASFGSEGLCSHCTHKNVCLSSTTTVRLGASRIECNGYDVAVSGTETFVTKMKYKFEYDEKEYKK